MYIHSELDLCFLVTSFYPETNKELHLGNPFNNLSWVASVDGSAFLELWVVQILTSAPGELQTSLCESLDVTLAWEDWDDPQAHKVIQWA